MSGRKRNTAEAVVWGLWVTGMPQRAIQGIHTCLLGMLRGWKLQVMGRVVSKQEPFKELSRNALIYFLLQFLPTPTFPFFCLLLLGCVSIKEKMETFRNCSSRYGLLLTLVVEISHRVSFGPGYSFCWLGNCWKPTGSMIVLGMRRTHVVVSHELILPQENEWGPQREPRLTVRSWEHLFGCLYILC